MKAKVNKTSLEVCERIPLISNNYNSIILDVEFSDDWNGLIKTAIFTNGDITLKWLNPSGSVPVPIEVLEPEKEVKVAFYGEKIINGEKVISLATHYASLGTYVTEGADPNAPPPTPPTPEVWEQLQADVVNHEERIETLEQGGSGASFNIHALTEEDSLADNDEMPFYDASAGAPRKTTWASIKAKLKSYFDTLYLGATALVGYATQMWVQSQGYGTYSKPTGGIPKTDLASGVQASLDKADSALQEHQSLADYSTTAQMNAAISAHHDSTKQDVINDLDDIRSGAELGASALQEVPNTYRTASAQDVIDNGKLNASEIKRDPDNNVYKIGSSDISAVYDGNGDEISTTYAKANAVMPKVLGNLSVHATVSNSDYLPIAEAPDGDAEKVSVTTLKQFINNDNVAKAQGVSHSGEFLVVGSDGNVTTANLPIYDGGVE